MRKHYQSRLPNDIPGKSAGPVKFFKETASLFKDAVQAAGEVIDRFYRIGRRNIQLQFAGQALVPFMTPALEHLAVGPVSQPDLKVCLWDCHSTGISLPSLQWLADAKDIRAAMREYNTDSICTFIYHKQAALALLDTESNIGLYGIQDTLNFPFGERSYPLLEIIHCWMRTQNIQLVHAGAVGRPNGGVLLAGKRLSGKSTIALSCLNSELLYANDDYSLVSTDPASYVYSLYNTAKTRIEKNELYQFQHLTPAFISEENQKKLFYLQDICPEKITKGFPLKAVLSLTITNLAVPRLNEVSPSFALKKLAPSTMFQLHGTGVQDFKKMADLVKQVPCYNLEFGRDISTVPDIILKLLS